MGDKNQGSAGFCKNTITEKTFKLGGKIWISTTDNSISYQCVVCKCEYSSGELFEQHIPRTRIPQCRAEPQPKPQSQQSQPQQQQNPPAQSSAQPTAQPSAQPPTQQKEAEQSAAKQNESIDYRQQKFFHGAIDRRRFSNVFTNRRRFSSDVNRRQANIFPNWRQEMHEKLRGETTVPHRFDAQHHRPAKTEIDQLIRCMKCDCKFKSLESLREHNRRRHSYCCTLCIDTKNDGNLPKSFETEKGLWSHQWNHHPERFPYKCNVCPRAFESRKQLNKHEETKHVRGNNHECDFCTKKLMSVFHKKNHIRKHHPDRRYHCQLCKYLFQQFSSFTYPISIESNLHNFFYWFQSNAHKFHCDFSIRHRIHDKKFRCSEAPHEREASPSI